jgi:hypothetical protein
MSVQSEVPSSVASTGDTGNLSLAGIAGTLAELVGQQRGRRGESGSLTQQQQQQGLRHILDYLAQQQGLGGIATAATAPQAPGGHNQGVGQQQPSLAGIASTLAELVGQQRGRRGESGSLTQQQQQQGLRHILDYLAQQQAPGGHNQGVGQQQPGLRGILDLLAQQQPGLRGILDLLAHQQQQGLRGVDSLAQQQGLRGILDLLAQQQQQGLPGIARGGQDDGVGQQQPGPGVIASAATAPQAPGGHNQGDGVGQQQPGAGVIASAATAPQAPGGHNQGMGKIALSHALGNALNDATNASLSFLESVARNTPTQNAVSLMLFAFLYLYGWTSGLEKSRNTCMSASTCNAFTIVHSLLWGLLEGWMLLVMLVTVLIIVDVVVVGALFQSNDMKKIQVTNPARSVTLRIAFAWVFNTRILKCIALSVMFTVIFAYCYVEWYTARATRASPGRRRMQRTADEDRVLRSSIVKTVYVFNLVCVCAMLAAQLAADAWWTR